MSASIQVRLPDGALRSLPIGANALDLAKSISEGLARDVVVARVNGTTSDLQAPLADGDTVELLRANSPEGIDTLRHSTEHILAAAVCHLFPGAQVTMGPKSHGGDFYYDFDIGRPFTPDDLVEITKEMQKIIEKKTQFSRREVSKAEALEVFSKLKQRYKPEILEWIPGDTVTLYQSDDFVDLCRGPHLPHTGFIKAFKLMAISGCYWRADSSKEMLQRISGIAFSSKKELDEYLHRIEEAKKRDHRKIGRELELFIVSEKYDSHEYSSEGPIDMLVTGSVDNKSLKEGKLRADSVLDDSLLDGLRDIFAPRTIKMTGYNVSSHDDDSRPAVDIKIRLFSGPIAKEQKEQLAALESAVNARHPGGSIRLFSEAHYTEEVGPGLVMWLPKGGRLRHAVETQWRKMHFEGGYDIVYSPHLAKSDLWKTSGHWSFYRDGMFSPMAIDGQEYVAKPMNCPFHILMYKSRPRSYRELPLRLCELGTVYRYELAGVMHGLMRVRGFTQDDAHLFCRWDQLDQEIDRVIGFILRVLRTFGFSEFELNLSTRPEKYVGELSDWARAEASLESAIKRYDLPYVVDEGGGAFYGPKIDFKLKDCLGRMWQCSTLQLDFNNPERFGIVYTSREGKPERPVMLHRALLGSLERFIGILVEQYAGAFPAWLSPEQIRVVTITDRHNEHAQNLVNALQADDLRITLDDSNEPLKAKISRAQHEKIPLMLVIGDKEVEQGGATVRLRDGSNAGFFSLEDLRAYCGKQCAVPVVE